MLQDLLPYLCTYVDCPFGDRLYGSRREWLEHENTMHRRIWVCRFHPSLTFTNQQSLEHHLRAEGHGFVNEEQIVEFASIAQSVVEDRRSQCPICRETTACIPQFAAHLAHHLERISTFSLPRISDNNDSSLASFKAASQTLSGQDSLSSISSNASWSGPAQDDSAYDSQQVPLKDEIVSWLSGPAYPDTKEDPRTPLNAVSFKAFSESKNYISWRDGRSPQRLVCCGLDQAQLVSDHTRCSVLVSSELMSPRHGSHRRLYMISKPKFVRRRPPSFST